MFVATVQWRLQDFFVGGARGGGGGGGGLSSSEGVLKKLIQLRQCNEHLNFNYEFFYIQQFQKRHI